MGPSTDRRLGQQGRGVHEHWLETFRRRSALPSRLSLHTHFLVCSNYNYVNLHYSTVVPTFVVE